MTYSPMESYIPLRAIINISLSSFLQHGNAVRQKWLDLFDLIAEGKTKQRPPNFEVPDRELPCRLNVQPGTWFARDNVFNFILFCRKLGNFLYYTLYTPNCSKIQKKWNLEKSHFFLERLKSKYSPPTKINFSEVI